MCVFCMDRERCREKRLTDVVLRQYMYVKCRFLILYDFLFLFMNFFFVCFFPSFGELPVAHAVEYPIEATQKSTPRDFKKRDG